MVKLLPVFHLFFIVIFLCNGNSAQGQTLKITAALNEPYVMLKQSAKPLTGNDQFEGYSIDLIDEISKILDLNYSIQLAPYNSDKKTGAWDRIVTELLQHHADIAIGDLTITSEREEVVDFSAPFMHTGISILYTKPLRKPPTLFAFMGPFTPSVWISLAIAYMVVSGLMYILGRFTPSYLSQQDAKDDGQFSMMNCMFLPRSLSTQLAAGVWWFFVLVMVSMYSANCAAFATVENLEYTISGVDDLARQFRIKYGVVKGGSTASFFRNSNNPTYKKIWSAMESSELTAFVSNSAEGVSRVVERNGKYAFLMESVAIEYATERRCELTQVGPVLDSKNYGIAMTKNSTYRSQINVAILKLQEDGKLQTLQKRWWKEKRGGGSCDFFSSHDDFAPELGLENLMGVFIVLIIGLGIACIIAACECLFKRMER
ncbi:hypothetical protein HA402_013431 [Bradysia odoriphaga]|nr:hypothetical protein HA402_013431 [Bradysia odoriphaga]